MKLFIAGDFCPQQRVAKLIDNKDFGSVLGDVKSLISNADYSIVNFECPVVLKDEKPLPKAGPNLKCSKQGLESLKWTGFKCVTLANNHFLDYGEQGIQDTLNECARLGIDIVGGGNNLGEAEKTLYKNISNKTLAIINCCEHEFSIATEESGGSNPLNPIKQYYAIKEAKANADHVLIIVHGGHEHFQLPSPRMQETYRFFVDAGADAVINHHQHCYSGYEIYNGKPILYGLGNFCFDRLGNHTKMWTEGYAVMLDFGGERPKFELYPYCQCAEEPRVEFLKQNAFDERIKELNHIIETPKALQNEINNYYAGCVENYSNIFEPFYNKVYLGAKYRKWIPSLINKKRKLAAYNYILCEAHRDKLMWWLTNNV